MKPPLKQSPYITLDGFEDLRTEYDYLWLKKRPEVTRALGDAAAEGDRSENAEYIYRKKELREIDRRVRYLQKRIPVLKVVRDLPQDQSKVYFGAWVRVINDKDEERVFRIVGKDEIDTKGTKISIDSPVAQALLKRQAGDSFQVTTPRGSVEYEVLAVSYSSMD